MARGAAIVTDEPKNATQISVWACRHGSVHIELLDENGEVFATASVPIEGWLDCMDVLDEQIAAAMQSEEEVVGHA